MSVVPTEFPAGRRFGDRIGDRVLYGLTAAAGLGAVALIIGIAYKVFDGSSLAFSKFGFGFIVDEVWNPVKNQFGALDLIWGTAVTSFIAILFAAPLAIGIALYLTELAPRVLRDAIGALVEMLAAIPSVILGLWGILVLGPFMQHDLEPFLKSFLGWLPIFSGDTNANGGKGILTASIILTIMAVPIIASVARELFASVPADLKDGARALGATRWEVVRGVVLHATRPGLAAAVILGLGRALGEAIAVTQVIGSVTQIPNSLFGTGDTLASRIAAQYQGYGSNLQASSLFYLAAILLVFSLVVNFGAQLIVRRFEFQNTGGS
ncbi:MAG: phosphate ABC transporter permease subunit PstC [Actinobacteria bacterium]|nr:phosphate ABC transporter permease subunit PstC [Actinomycetota bacterium]